MRKGPVAGANERRSVVLMIFLVPYRRSPHVFFFSFFLFYMSKQSRIYVGIHHCICRLQNDCYLPCVSAVAVIHGEPRIRSSFLGLLSTTRRMDKSARRAILLSWCHNEAISKQYEMIILDARRLHVREWRSRLNRVSGGFVLVRTSVQTSLQLGLGRISTLPLNAHRQSSPS